MNKKEKEEKIERLCFELLDLINKCDLDTPDIMSALSMVGITLLAMQIEEQTQGGKAWLENTKEVTYFM